MSCCGSVLACFGNTLYFIVNFLFLLIGNGLLSLGLMIFFLDNLLTTTTSDEITLKIDTNMISLAIVLVSVGGALILIAILAFVGSAIKFIEKIIIVLYILLTLLVMAYICFIIALVVMTDRPKDVDPVHGAMENLIKFYKPPTGKLEDFSISGKFIDVFQNNYHCCGVESYKDYGTNGMASQVSKEKWDLSSWKGSSSQNIIVPPTCCRTLEESTKWKTDNVSNSDLNGLKNPTANTINAPSCYTDTPSSIDVHTERNCVTAFYQEVDKYELEIILVSSAALILFLIILVALFVKLCSRSKED